MPRPRDKSHQTLHLAKHRDVESNANCHFQNTSPRPQSDRNCNVSHTYLNSNFRILPRWWGHRCVLCSINFEPYASWCVSYTSKVSGFALTHDNVLVATGRIFIVFERISYDLIRRFHILTTHEYNVVLTAVKHGTKNLCHTGIQLQKSYRDVDVTSWIVHTNAPADVHK